MYLGGASTISTKLRQRSTRTITHIISVVAVFLMLSGTAVAENKVRLDQQKTVLAANIKSMYLDSAVTPLEMLASSKNFSDFLDQQQYQDKIKSKIQDAMAQIETLQKALESQQTQLTEILNDQRSQQ